MPAPVITLRMEPNGRLHLYQNFGQTVSLRFKDANGAIHTQAIPTNAEVEIKA